MKKIAFIQNVSDQLHGYMYMSAYLKKNGHDCAIFVNNFEKDILKNLLEHKPDIVGFYTTTGNLEWGLSLMNRYKAHNKTCLTVAGGPHATFHPEDKKFKNSGLDAICLGEGEEAILEIADLYDGKDKDAILKIRNLWIFHGDGIAKNPLRPLVEDLDALPFPDRSLYRKYHYYQNLETVAILASRGCPFSCTYCYAHVERELYSGLGAFLRLRSPENIIEEIAQLSKYFKKQKYVTFFDSTLNMNTKWFLELLNLYEKNVKLPFFCHIRTDILKEEHLDALAKANCQMVAFGIEAGSYRLRKDILKRNNTDDQIILAAEKIREKGLRFGTANMFGLPTETLEESYALIRINQKIRPDFISSTIFQPYPGTESGKLSVALGLIEKSDYDSLCNYYHHSILKQNDIILQERLQKLLFYFVKFPRWTRLLIILAKKAPFNFLCWVYYLSLAMNIKIAYGYSFIGIFKYGLMNFSYYSRK